MRKLEEISYYDGNVNAVTDLTNNVDVKIKGKEKKLFPDKKIFHFPSFTDLLSRTIFIADKFKENCQRKSKSNKLYYFKHVSRHN